MEKKMSAFIALKTNRAFFKLKQLSYEAAKAENSRAVNFFVQQKFFEGHNFFGETAISVQNLYCLIISIIMTCRYSEHGNSFSYFVNSKIVDYYFTLSYLQKGIYKLYVIIPKGYKLTLLSSFDIIRMQNAV